MTRHILVFVSLLAIAASAAAQTAPPPLEAGAALITTSSGQFHTQDIGGGGWVGWRITPVIGVEGELSYHSDPFADDASFSAGRLEGLFGVTAGPQLGAFRPFVSGRPGFVAYRRAGKPVACIAIFPPPLSCTLAAGRTVFAFDVGGGLEVSPSTRTVIRATLSDRMVRFPGPAFDTGGERHEDSFTGHDVRFAVGAGFRF